MLNYLKEITDLSEYVGTPAFCGVRVNPLRMTVEEFTDIAPFKTTPCRFWKYGLYIENEDKTGLHPLHFAGAYYIQEPSAMSAVTALDVKDGDKVLDCCAAPGSKATAIAPHCFLLVANEINAQRAGALISNIERMGISNALVLNSDTAALADAFTGYFDKVLVDSPCSGEGMFRKHPDILENWSEELVRMCAERSKKVLSNAARCLKEGGRLVYSTCTYNLEENERLIIDFLENNPDFEITDTGLDFGAEGFLGLTKARRIFIESGGEGHFVCALTRKKGGDMRYLKPFKLSKSFDFLNGITKPSPRFTAKGEFGVMEWQGVKYALPYDMPNPRGVRVLRAGVKLGQMQGKIFRPEHHLFMALDKDSILLKYETPCPESFLRGEETECDPSLRGYCAVTYKGLVLGFGKASGGRMKNHFPKGLRI
ncbi:MAG: RsmF rRNA methyltransferase first C-terminal domain-containing protein [Clostridia bacterium]|nr:RsmF rRNA methyltransferase first C-terminal domain-containing protein [Clostridia bacterium]